MANKKVSLWQLEKDYQFQDYLGRVVPTLRWVEICDTRESEIEQELTTRNLPYGIYSITTSRTTQYFEYFDKDKVEDAFYSIYYIEDEPLCSMCRIHWAEKEPCGSKLQYERYTGRVFSGSQMFHLAYQDGTTNLMDFVGDVPLEDLMEDIQVQLGKEVRLAKKKRKAKKAKRKKR